MTLARSYPAKPKSDPGFHWFVHHGIVGGPQPRLYEGGDPIWHDDDLA